MADDIIRAFVARLLAYTTPEEAQRVEIEFRQQWGGERHYVAKDVPTLKTWALAGSLAAGATIREAFDAVGCSRRTGYRLLSRRWR
jgi:hypothetical protein